MPNSLGSVLSIFESDNYRLGNCSLKVYNRRDPAFTKHFTSLPLHLYLKSQASSPHFLRDTFCGMRDLSSDAICSYLASRAPLILMCVDRPIIREGDPEFSIAGYAFPTVWCGSTPSATAANTTLHPHGRAALMGYAVFREFWGKPEATVLGMLSAAYFFASFGLTALHGQRYSHNDVSSRWLARYGGRSVGPIPRFLLLGEELIDMYIDTILREDFEVYVNQLLESAAAAPDGSNPLFEDHHGRKRRQHHTKSSGITGTA